MTPPRVFVKCWKCMRELTGPDVEFLDVCEDIAGRDLVTFHCPTCDEDRKGYAFTRGVACYAKEDR